MKRISIILTILAFLFINATPVASADPNTCITLGLLVNPTAGTTLADTGAFTVDQYDSSPTTIIISSSSRVWVVFEHMATDGVTVLRSHSFNVDGSFYCQINQGAAIGERFRLRLLTGLLLGNSAQGTLSSSGF